MGLRELREAKGYSQRELANLAEVSQVCIWKIENGKSKPHPSTRRKLAALLGAEPTEI